MRNRSAAKSAASSPPVPARISSTVLRSSFGSRGSSSSCSRSSRAASSRLERGQLAARHLAHVRVGIAAAAPDARRRRAPGAGGGGTLRPSPRVAIARAPAWRTRGGPTMSAGSATSRSSSSYRRSISARRSSIAARHARTREPRAERISRSRQAAPVVASARLLSVLPVEALDPARGVHQLQLTGEERMARRADVDVDVLLGGAGLDDVAARTDDGGTSRSGDECLPSWREAAGINRPPVLAQCGRSSRQAGAARAPGARHPASRGRARRGGPAAARAKRRPCAASPPAPPASARTRPPGRRAAPRPRAVVSTRAGRSTGDAEHVGLELHQEVVRRRAAVDAQRLQARAGVGGHRVDDVAGLEGERLERGAHEVRPRDAAGEAEHGAARLGVPVRRAEPDEGRHDVDAERRRRRCAPGARTRPPSSRSPSPSRSHWMAAPAMNTAPSSA